MDSFSLLRYIFAKNMFELGCINPTEWAVYQDWHTFLVEQFDHQVALEGIIYLRASPQVGILKGGLYFETGLTAYATQLTQLSPPHHRSDLVRLPKIVTERRQCRR